MRKNKKAQVWTLDYIIGLLMFLATLSIAFTLIKSMDHDNNRFDDAILESNHISTQLIDTGHPINWDSNNVVILGICNNNRVDLAKLDEFDKMKYSRTKTLFQVSGEYIFYFEDSNGIINQTKCFRGYDLGETCTLNLSQTHFDNLAKSERIVILNSKIVKMVVLSWNKN